MPVTDTPPVLPARDVERIAAQLDRLERDYGAGAVRRLRDGLACLSGARDPRKQSGDPLQRPWICYLPELRASAWWDDDPAILRATRALESKWEKIRAEVLQLDGELTPYAEPEIGLVADGGAWNAMFVRLGSEFTAAGLSACPETCAILASIDALGGQVVASVIEPGAHIPSHCGPWNTRLSIHLGLDVPPGCRIRVGREQRTWREGRCLIFDDSFEHEVWNASPRRRSVLIVDVWHPQLSAIEIDVLRSAEALF
jgi:aspartate beta-hydroxylase